MNGFGQDVRGKDAEGKTALHRVADSDEDQPDLIEALVEKGADVNATNRRGQTPLYNAVQSKLIASWVQKNYFYSKNLWLKFFYL